MFPQIRTSQFIEFTVPENSDTASGDVTATVTLSADIDLYLQRRLEDGAWNADIAAGGSPSLTGEAMTIDHALRPGLYRIEVYNWAGLPKTQCASRPCSATRWVCPAANGRRKPMTA